MGGAVAVLSVQVDEMTKALETAQKTAGDSSGQLRELTERAESAASRIELVLASMHDFEEPVANTQVSRSSRGAVRRHRRTRHEAESGVLK